MTFDITYFIENVPLSYDDLESRNDREKWLGLVNKEWKSIVQNEKNVNNLDTKWVFTYKSLKEYENDIFKARLVVRGFMQKKTAFNTISTHLSLKCQLLGQCWLLKSI